MALPTSGTITLNDIRTELGLTGTISLNDTAVRALAGKTSGTVILPTDFYGKSNLPAFVWSPNPVTYSDYYADCSIYINNGFLSIGGDNWSSLNFYSSSPIGKNEGSSDFQIKFDAGIGASGGGSYGASFTIVDDTWIALPSATSLGFEIYAASKPTGYIHVRRVADPSKVYSLRFN